MKKYFSFILIAAFLYSCSKDLLDTVPNDRLSENVFWKTQADAEVAVNSLYRDLDGQNILAWDAFTDIAHVNQPFAVDAFIELGTYDATSSKILTEWSNAYTGIAADNYFLANVDKIPVITDSNTFKRYKAEARFLRAYQYVKLTSLYGAVPLTTAVLSIEDARKLKRASLSDIYSFIDAELTAVAAVLPASYSGANVGRATKGAALALKARADLYAGHYADAATAAKAVIDAHTYTLYPTYKTLFTYKAENNSEVILDKQFIASTYSNSVFNLLASYSQKSAQSTYVPTKAGVDQYESGDARKGFSVYLDGDVLPDGSVFHPAPNSGTPDAVGNTYIASTTGYNIKKYINTEDLANPSNNGINIILIRYAEVLLTYAEAKIESNAIDQSVFDAINAVRNTRTDVVLPAISAALTQDQLRSAVRHERIVELAFEGLHLQDIRRWKTAATVVPGPVYGITYNDGGTSKTIQVAVNRVFDANKHYLWPIPQTERDQDPSLDQNPGW